MSLSTGKPKTTDKPLETVYLRTRNNVVSDVVRVETKDLCRAEVRLSYRVDFEGEDSRQWFDVENYVKFLCDHARSMLKNAVKQISVRDFYADGIEIVRDIVLGKKGKEDGRPGLEFNENGMRVYDVEVFGIKISNDKLANELNNRASKALHDALDLEDAQRDLSKTKELELIGVERVRVQNEATRSKAGLTLETAKVEVETDIERIKLVGEQAVIAHKEEMAREAEKLLYTEEEKKRHMVQFDTEIEQAKQRAEVVITKLKDELAIEKERMKAEGDKATAIGKAIDPQFTAALAALGQNDLVEKLAEAIGPMSIFEDEDVIDLLKARFGSLGIDHLLERIGETMGRTLGDDTDE
jgi:major vault protein